MNRIVRRKRILIVLTWLVFMAVSGLLFSVAARSFFFGRAKTDLLAQAEAMEKRITELAQNNLFTERDAGKIKAAKIRTLGFALEQYPSIDDAKEFPDDFVDAADIAGLAVYDRE